MTFKDNWNFSEKYINDVRDILQANAMHIVKIEVATPEEDMKQATDLKIKITAGDVAVRIRRGKYDFRDITIRAYKNGNKTELHKLREGYGDWYLYAWEDKNQDGIAEWVLVDINKARSLFNENKEVKMNKDGNSGFVSYSIEEVRATGALVAHKKNRPCCFVHWLNSNTQEAILAYANLYHELTGHINITMDID